MSDYEIRQFTEEEIAEHYLSLEQYAFYPSPSKQPEGWKPEREQHNYLIGAFINKKPVAMAKYIPMIENMRGSLLRMGGVASVATLPEHRRRGLAKTLLRHLFEQMNRDGYYLSTLYPFRESFYAALGYAKLPARIHASIDPTNLPKYNDLLSKYSIVRTRVGERHPVIHEFLKKLSRKIHGMGVFEHPPLLSNPERWLVTLEKDGEIRGILQYRIEGFTRPLRIMRFFYWNGEARNALLSYLGMHTDQVSSIEVDIHPHENLDFWGNDIYPLLSRPAWVPSPMGRIINVEKLDKRINLPSKQQTPAVSLTIEDQHCPWNNQSFVFSNEYGILRVEPESTSAESITIEALSAMMYNGAGDNLHYLKSWRLLSQETRQALGKLFLPARPSLVSFF